MKYANIRWLWALCLLLPWGPSSAHAARSIFIESTQIFHVYQGPQYLGSTPLKVTLPLQTPLRLIQRKSSLKDSIAVGRPFLLFRGKGKRWNVKQTEKRVRGRCNGRMLSFLFRVVWVNGTPKAVEPLGHLKCHSEQIQAMVRTFPKIVGLRLAGIKCKPPALRWLAQLKQLRWLKLNFMTSLKQAPTYLLLKQLKQLRWLRLHSANISVAGLAQLTQLHTLELVHSILHRSTPARSFLGPQWKRLHRLTFESTKPAKSDIDALARLPKLKDLTLASSVIPAAHLRGLRALRRLHTLRLRRLYRWEKGSMGSLPKGDKLHTLELKELRGLTASDLGPIYTRKSLRRLTIKTIKHPTQALLAMHHLPQLTHLSFVQANLKEKGLRGLRTLSKLRRLDLRYTLVTHKGLKHLMAATQLQHLHIASNKITDQAMPLLARLTQLSSLKLPYASLTDKGLAHLRSLRKLRSLRLGIKQASAKGMQVFARLKALHTLGLQGKGINYKVPNPKPVDPKAVNLKGLLSLRNLRNLRKLHLEKLPLNKSALKVLASLQQLTLLQMRWAKIANSSLLHFQGHPKLRELDISYTKINAKGLRHLCKIPHIQVLYGQHLRIYNKRLKHWSKTCKFFFHKETYNFH